MSATTSVPTSILVDKIKRLEEEVNRQGKLIEMQQSQIQTLNALVTNLMQQSNQSSTQILFQNSNKPTNSSSSVPMPFEREHHMTSTSSSASSSSSSNNKSANIQKVQAGRIQFSNKRQRALSITRVFIESLPPFGLKSVTLPGGNDSDHLEDSAVKKRGRTKKAIPSLDTSAFRSLSSLSPATHTEGNMGGLSSHMMHHEGSTRTITSNAVNTSDQPMITQEDLRIETTTPIGNVRSVNNNEKRARLEFDVSHCKTLMRFEDRLILCEAMLKQVNQRGTYHIQTFLASGGRDLFILWLKDEYEALSRGASTSDQLMYTLTQILEYAGWTEETVTQVRYDKLLRRIYRKCSDHPVYKSSALVVLVRRIWPIYRALYYQGGSQAGSNDDDDDI